ncbi:caspase family protein [Spirosoma aerolatum]|uniref:caspase family protein n=1 Tax=Spirosoma aerolatum TaxID=1211326 RepID=UPI0009ABB6B7|nr:caspase family protein [Spirosoma aerolatum]
MFILRQLILSTIWGFLAMLLLPITPGYAQTKRALIVAIGDYPNKTNKNRGATEWQDISSANDVPLIRESLRRQNFTDIIVLRDAAATKRGIQAALDTLISRCKKGDIVVIHFSSHGQQIDDDNKDELDAYDEAIVCYGAPIEATGNFKTYNGDQHLRDDELGSFINRLRTKLGADGDVLLLADACHSGTITRGNAGMSLTRGTDKPMHLSGYQKRTAKHVSNRPRPFLADIASLTASQTGMAPYVVISAARADEANQECVTPANLPAGSLSYAFSRSMTGIRSGETYRFLFNRIVTELQRMGKSQHPEIEGMVDRQLFGGQAVPQLPYYTISELAETRQQLIIPAGQLEMIYPGTTVSVCPSGTTDPANTTKAISGTVAASTLFKTTINLSKPLPKGLESEYWVFIRERTFGDLSVLISLDSLKQPALRQQVQGVLTKLPLVKFDQKVPELLVCQRDSAGMPRVVIRRTSDGAVFGNPIWLDKPADAEKVSLRVQDYVQAKFLQNFNPSYLGINLRMELLPNKPQSQNAYDTTSREPFLQNGILALPPGWVSVRISNTGDLPVYFSIIDIQPDGIVSVMFPRPKSDDKPDDYRIEPGKSLIIPSRVKISPPYGNETFKLLASLEKFDLRNLIKIREQGGGLRDKGITHVWAKAFGMAQLLARGGTSEDSFPETTIGSFSYPFLIIPAKP